MGKINGKSITLDEADWKLIWLLVKNCRAPLKELAQKTGLTIDSVFRRMKSYEQSGLIEMYTVGLSLPIVGFHTPTYVSIGLKNVSGEAYNELIEYLTRHEKISDITSVMGEFDLVIVVMAENNKDFEKISREIRHKFRDIIDVWESMPIMRSYKYNFTRVKEQQMGA